jgi:hypothetical protein
MRPLQKAMAKKIVEIVETQVFLSHGVPEIVIADNGSQFISKESNELLTKYKIPKFWKNALHRLQNNRTNQLHHQDGGESVYR